MLTKHTYDSAAFSVLLNIIKISLFIGQKSIETFYEILYSIMAFIAIYTIKMYV